MGVLVLLGVLLVVVALIASQFPHWLTVVAIVANLGVYAALWHGMPAEIDEMGPQIFQITVLIGGQVAAILGLLLPFVWSPAEGWPRWLRALGGAAATLPIWLLAALVLY
ncbi:MAG: hypothetical protein AAF311_17685 [Pseudomonadota bacterium]